MREGGAARENGSRTSGLGCREGAVSPRNLQGTSTAGRRPWEGSMGRQEESGQAEGGGGGGGAATIKGGFARRAGGQWTNQEALSK